MVGGARGWGRGGGGGRGLHKHNNNTIIHVPDRAGNTVQNTSVTKRRENNRKTFHLSFRDNVITGRLKKCNIDPMSANAPHLKL